ncbi:hypothetical protein FJZ17_04310 [Candidatus Pacearchaeota archaeon]|nr:hypothetical protein [Candidatus Pacearchaeota archaeon]
MTSFVCISGVSETEQLRAIRKAYRERGLGFPLAIGYQLSNKSINQGTKNSRQPLFSKLGALVRETKSYGFLPSLHYYTKDNSTILGDIETIADQGIDPNETLLQFNTLPLSPEDLRKIDKRGFKVIFPIAISDRKSPAGGYAVWKGEGVEDVSEGNVQSLVQQVLARKDFIDYVMFDPSHGTNLELDLSEGSTSIKFGKQIIQDPSLAHLGMVYAGGISPENVAQIISRLLSFFPRQRISIDTESGVRTNDQLDLGKVSEYLVRCQALF